MANTPPIPPPTRITPPNPTPHTRHPRTPKRLHHQNPTPDTPLPPLPPRHPQHHLRLPILGTRAPLVRRSAAVHARFGRAHHAARRAGVAEDGGRREERPAGGGGAVLRVRGRVFEEEERVGAVVRGVEGRAGDQRGGDVCVAAGEGGFGREGVLEGIYIA